MQSWTTCTSRGQGGHGFLSAGLHTHYMHIGSLRNHAIIFTSAWLCNDSLFHLRVVSVVETGRILSRSRLTSHTFRQDARSPRHYAPLQRHCRVRRSDVMTELYIQIGLTHPLYEHMPLVSAGVLAISPRKCRLTVLCDVPVRQAMTFLCDNVLGATLRVCFIEAGDRI